MRYVIACRRFARPRNFRSGFNLLPMRGQKVEVVARIDRLKLGNPGDVAPVGDGASEMRIHYGPGYRVYFAQRGEMCTVLIGGDKSTQAADIKRAKHLATREG